MDLSWMIDRHHRTQQRSGDGQHAKLTGSVVVGRPQAFRVSVKQDKGAIVHPAAGGESHDLAVKFAVVHDNQGGQRSVGDGNVNVAELVIHHFFAN